MKRIKVTSNKTVLCPRTGTLVNLFGCYGCEDVFGIVEQRYVLCKRGRKEDFLGKSGNRRKKNGRGYI